MIPSKSKALLMTGNSDEMRSMTLAWTGLGLALVFLAYAAICAN